MAVENKISTIAMCHVDPQSMSVELPQYEIDALKSACKVQVLLNCFKNDFAKWGLSNIICISNVVPQFHDKEIKKYNHDNNTIIFVGRLEKIIKRPHILIEVFALVADKHPTCKVKFYGSNDNKKYVKEMKRRINHFNLNNRVEFCGTTTNIYDMMLQADIFVSTSNFEGFHLAVTEAMSIGLPVLGFKSCKSLNEIIIDGETGLLANDINDMADKLSRLMGNRALRKSLGGSAHVSMKKYSPKIIWDRWNDVIEETINNY